MHTPGPDENELLDLLSVAELREMTELREKVKFDVTPQILMEPRFQTRPEDLAKLKEITGYMFYIETECEPPSLMLMKIGRTDITSTIGYIESAPQELIRKALENPVHPPVHGMYAITEEIREWLKKELGF